MIRPDWSAPLGVHAAFSVRSGGVSRAPFASLNVGVHVGDDPLAVQHNRRQLANQLALPGEPLWLDQVHGTAVYTACVPETVAVGAPHERPVADAAVTASAGVVLAIQVADCLPVLFASRDGRVLGAAHAGWRGLAAGVLERTVTAMGQLAEQPLELCAWLGPCIGPAHFEVGSEVREAFVGAGDPPEAFEQNSRGRWQCDLLGIARRRLGALGVRSVGGGEWCTAADPVRFFSHRRDQRTGRMVALLWRDAER